MKFSKILACVLVAALVTPLATGGVADAATRKRELNNKSNFTAADAVKGQDYVRQAMTTPLLDLLRKADVNHPDKMLIYGLALELGRESVSQQMPKDEREQLKRGFRAMLDLYISKSDKFDITFDEDAMLDQPEFWIYLAKHAGRKKNTEQFNQNLPISADPAQGTSAFFVPDGPSSDSEFNLNQDLILRPNVVNASTSCVESAFAFARMKKAQTVDIAETKLTPEQFATVQEKTVRVYRLSYSQGIAACGGKDFFTETADFASGHLGRLGELKDNPAAVLAPLSDPTAEDLKDK